MEEVVGSSVTHPDFTNRGTLGRACNTRGHHNAHIWPTGQMIRICELSFQVSKGIRRRAETCETSIDIKDKKRFRVEGEG